MNANDILLFISYTLFRLFLWHHFLMGWNVLKLIRHLHCWRNGKLDITKFRQNFVRVRRSKTLN